MEDIDRRLRIALGSDGAGYPLKHAIHGMLEECGHECIDVGTDNEAMVDYPDFALKVAGIVASGRADRGILICGTGIGMSVAANKVRGVRAALCHDTFGARMSRSHNDANVLCMGAWEVTAVRAEGIVSVWITERYAGGRHAPRLRRIEEYERLAAEGEE